MTSPNFPADPVPAKTYTAGTVASLQHADRETLAIADNQATYEQAEDVRGAFFTVIYQQVQQIPIIGGLIGDIIEIITGVEDGDLDDLGSWVNGLGNFVNNLIASALHLLASLLDMVPIVGDTLSAIITGIADGVNSTHSTATAAESAAETAQQQVTDLATVAVTSVTTPIWASTDGSDIVTFPRVLMQPVVSTITGAASGSGTHSHSIGRNPPTYKPGKRALDLYFIRSDRKTNLARFKLIMGGDGAFGIDAMYLVLYIVNPTTNVLTKIWDSGNVAGTIGGDSRLEYGVTMGSTFTAMPGHLFAAGQLQIAPGLLQETRTIASIPQTNVQQASGTWPPAPGGYLTDQSTAPATIAMSSLTLDNSKVGWFALAP